MAERFSGNRDERRNDPVRGAGKSGGLVVWLSGADPHVLAKVPRERRKFSGLGGVVLTTAIMATLSAIFALSSGVRAPLFLAIPLGLLWGLAIMNLDRWLVTAAVRRDRWYQNLAVALPRLFLALIIGAVISTPLVLWIFQREINAELDVIHQQKLDQQAQILNNDARFKGIPALQARVAKLQGIVDGTAPPESVEDDPTVKQLKAQYDALDKQYRDAQASATCELDGSCGTHHVGAGTSYQQKQRVADDLKRQRDAVGAQLASARQSATARIGNSAASARQSAADELARDRAELTRLTTLKKQESDQFAASNREDRGLLAQMEALTHFTNHSFTLKTSYLALLLFITAIEVLPVFTKFLMNLGPPSLYDEILAQAEETDKQTAATRLAAEVEIHEKETDRWRTEQLSMATSAPVEEPRSGGGGLTGLLGTLGQSRSTPRRRRRSNSEYADWPDAEDGGSTDEYGSDEDGDRKWGWQ